MLILPVGDINKRKTVPFFNYLLIFANVAIFVWLRYLEPQPRAGYLFEISLLVPEKWTIKTLFTSMFQHADELHLFGNMLFLWIAGDSVEDRMGHLPYLMFYFLAGLAGSAAHIHMATGPMPSLAKYQVLG